MTKRVTHQKKWKIGIFVLLSLALLVSYSCKSPGEPEIVANIIAQNLSGAALDIFMDGVFQFSVEYAADETIYDLPPGIYNLEGKKKGEEILAYSDTIEITQSINYIVVIEGPSFIVVENKYGEGLNIYWNGILFGGVPDKGGVVIPKVAFGKHEMAAVRISDNLLVESLTLEVENVTEYIWTINPPATD